MDRTFTMHFEAWKRGSYSAISTTPHTNTKQQQQQGGGGGGDRTTANAEEGDGDGGAAVGGGNNANRDFKDINVKYV